MISRQLFSIAILLLFVIACNETPKQQEEIHPAASKRVDIQLIDTLGSVTLSVPVRYDTSFSWTDYSDCGKPCDMHKYRFQPKDLKIIKESGWVSNNQPKDSIERFTISHSEYFPFRNGDTAKDVVRHNHIKDQISQEPANRPIVFDTIEKIGDRYYSIIQIERSDSIQLKKVFAVTTIQGNVIWFQYDLLTNKKDSIVADFIKNTMSLIRTIQIKKGI